jgi:excisionase family DNA binding protein
MTAKYPSHIGDEMPDLTVADAAKLLSCSHRTIYQMMADGKLDSFVVGSVGRRIRRDSFERLRTQRGLS